MSRKTKVWVAVAIAAATLLVVSAIFILPNLFKKPTVEDAIKESTVGKNITGLTQVDGEPAASVIIAPPTDKWWAILNVYSANPVSYTLDFSKYSEGSKYIAYTSSTGGNFKSYGYLGLPTSFIIYDSEDKAEDMDVRLSDDGISHQLIGDTIFFVPEGAYSDVNYALNQYDNASDGKDLELNGQAMMFLEYSSLKRYMTEPMAELDAETFDTLASVMGMTEETTWSGTSPDGFNWEGSFNNLDVASLNTPSDIQTYLGNRSYFLDADGNLRPAAEATEDNQTGILYPGQSTLIGDGYLTLQSNDDSTNVLDDEGNPQYAPKLAPSEGVFRATIKNVNGFIGGLLGDGVNYSYTTLDSIIITVQKDGSSSINITPDESLLEPAKPDEGSKEE